VRFTIKCHVLHHVSGRVTLTPLDFPDLAVHALDLSHAKVELLLALEDKISRVHPRYVHAYARTCAGQAFSVEAPLLKVWGSSENETRALRLMALASPTHGGYRDVRVPCADLRFWSKEDDVHGELARSTVEYVVSRASEHDPNQILKMRPEGEESFEDIVVEARPLRLSDLKPSELYLDERASAKPVSSGDDEDGDDEDEDDEDDNWEDEGRRRSSEAKKNDKKKKATPKLPTINKLGTSLLKLAREGELEPAFERDALIEDLRQRLVADERSAIALLGVAGVGKTAVLHELCRRWAESEASAPVGVFLLDGSRLIAGEGFLGDWQLQVLGVTREARDTGAILYMGRAVELLDAGKSAHSQQNVAQFLLPVLSGREVRVVVEATPEEWTQVESRNAGFARLFDVFRVEEPDERTTAGILAKTSQALAKMHGLSVFPAVVDEVRLLCARFLPYGSPLGNAVTFLRRLLAAQAQAKAETVSALDARLAFSAESGIPEKLVRDDLPLDPGDVSAFLSARVMGQTAAVERVVNVVSVIKANLADRRRPCAVLLFAGPTGVGKTELSKALAEFVFGGRDRMVRLDMGEYAGPDALDRLLFGEGTLAARVRRQPFCVVLLDEIEKAHPVVFDALLGVLGEGRLTDASGRFTDFRNAIVIMTSNIGAETARSTSGFIERKAEDVTAHYKAEVRRFFRPELYNRLDDVVVFSPLGPSEISRILSRELAHVSEREGFRRNEIDLQIEGSVQDRLAHLGIDSRYGARPLKRAIERELVVPVAGYLASHMPMGATRLHASVENDGLSLSAESLPTSSGLSRSAIQKWLDRAADLRADIRAWAMSPPMVSVRQDVVFFDRESRHPAFWSDQAMAEQRARRVALGRELMQDFDKVQVQAETIEDLAYEAYWTRQSSRTPMESEMAELDAAQDGLAERVFATMYPGATDQASLLIVPSRGGRAQALWLAETYARWAIGRKGEVICHAAWPKAKADAPPKTKENCRFHKLDLLNPNKDKEARNTAMAFFLSIATCPGVVLLSGEHGVHRFLVSGMTHLVKVHVELRARRIQGDAFVAAEWDKKLPTDEIRRISMDKDQLRDLRLNRDYVLFEGDLDLAQVLRDFLHFRVFGRVDERGRK
jgi:ATP-dependent Clp protease ATP-binding subunit ClpC